MSGPTFAPRPRWCAESNATAFFTDYFTRDDALRKLAYAESNRRATGQPWFLGVGLRKPHLDWRVPPKFLNDIGPASAVLPPRHRTPPASMPPIAYHGPGRDTGETELWAGWGFTDPWTPMRNETVVDMRRHYYAAVAFMDSIVGDILQGLAAHEDASSHGKNSNTLVLFTADHGWSLGESNYFRKFSLSELGTRVPLIISVPWLPHLHGTTTTAFAELVDIMPTLSDLAGLPPPVVRPGEAPLAGTSLAPTVSTGNPVKYSALSVYPRCPINVSVAWRENWCIHVSSSAFHSMGYSLRMENWRYTAWVPWDGQHLQPLFPAVRTNGSFGFAEELYHYPRGDTTHGLDNFDELDVDEVSRQYASQAEHMFQILRNLTQQRSHRM